MTRLHPAGATDSRALGVTGQQQVGTVDGNAALWTGSQASFVGLGPGSANATDGVQQAGYAGTLGQAHATLWSGSAASAIDIAPVGYIYNSYATGIGGGQQVGYLPHQITARAVLWTGSAASMVDLSTTVPPTAYQIAWAVDAGQQVGERSNHACTWTGTAVSIVDINPTGVDQSVALAVNAGTQVGWAYPSFSSQTHAGLWHGTAASWVDLHPAGATYSKANAVFGSEQVGVASFGVDHAVLWAGSAGSMIDLHALLPQSYSSSRATGIWTSASGVTYVSGYARAVTNHDEAILWVRGGPPAVFCAGDGIGTPCPCGNNSPMGAGVGCLDSFGVGGALATSGTPSASSDTLVLVGSGMPNAAVLYFQGTQQAASSNGIPFGDGLRCANGTVIRLGSKSNVGGASQYPAAGEASIALRGGDVAGDVRTYQAWYRNAASFCTASTFNLTNGIALTWQP